MPNEALALVEPAQTATELIAISVTQADGVLHVTLNRPQARNAMSLQMVAELRQVLKDAEGTAGKPDAVRVVVLRGAGGHFCAGADLDKLVSRSLKGLPPENDWEQRIRDDYQVIFRGLLRSKRTLKPLIAAIEGSCIAGGVEILQATDIRVAAESAQRHGPDAVDPLGCHLRWLPDVDGLTLSASHGVAELRRRTRRRLHVVLSLSGFGR